MLILSLMLLALRNIGYAMDLGFHIQSPVFVLILLYVMFAIGLCFCGLFDIPFIFSCSDKASSSFFGGMLLTLVAISCITPFMAPAIGFALTQPSIPISISIFLFLGLGIALPYFIVSFFPNTLEFLPKPDEWTTALKHFPLFSVSLSIIWLFWMLTKESNTVPILTGLLSSAFSVWIWIFNNNTKPLIKPVISTLFFRLIHHRSSYPRQRKKSPFKATHKPGK
jgi:thiol:disulfide interchange protein DsbD